MALNKQITFKGASASYWKILRVADDVIRNKTMITVGVYVSQAIREADVNNTLTMKTYVLPGSDMTRAAIYAAFKALPDFQGASDC